MLERYYAPDPERAAKALLAVLAFGATGRAEAESARALLNAGEAAENEPAAVADEPGESVNA
jgi:hypothetical protein